MNKSMDRNTLFRWIGWFFLTTSVILFLIQLSFLKYLPNLQHIHGATQGRIILTWLFLFASYITQAVLLAFAASLIPLLVAWIIPRRFLVFSIAILLAAMLSIAQTIDIIAYNIYYSHELSLGFAILKTGVLSQVIPISLKEGLVLLGIIAAFLILYAIIAMLVWRCSHKGTTHRSDYWISCFIIVMFCFSYGLMATVVTLPKRLQLNETTSLMLLKAARLVPYYSDLYGLLMPINNKYSRVIQTPKGPLRYQTRQPNYPLQYPLHPLQCSPKEPLPNILFIVIDSWRYDAMNTKITPHINRFSKKTFKFSNQWSGGNGTQTGLFTLFYAIPPNYWDASIKHQKSPVFIRQLLKHHYETAIYASATLQFPAFDQTIFRDINNLPLRTPGNTTVKRDKAITKKFEKFLNQRNKKKPFFGFLLYDAAHNYCDGGENEHQTPFKYAIKKCARFSLTKTSNPTPYVKRYHNAIYFIDNQINQVLKQLKKHGLYKNTIIIITSDHGEQFNDEKLGFWSHTSAYTRHQLQIPLLIYWPNKKPTVIRYFTTNYDVIPTLLTRVFHCSNPNSDYSTGQLLFKNNRKPYLIAGNYTSYAVLTKHRIIRISPNGAYSIRYPDSRQIPNAVMNRKIMNSAYKELNRYFKRK